MWITRNYTPFEVAGVLGVDRDGLKTWLVAVRATFLIDAQGQLVRDKEQQPVSRAAAFEGDPSDSCLKWDADLNFTKRASDILLRGSAYAAGGQPCSHVDVGLQVGPLRKALRVHGERAWIRGSGNTLVPDRAQPFTTMPLTYARTFGGKDPTTDKVWSLNPLGRGYSEDPASLLHQLVPNLEDSRDPIVDAAHRPNYAAGFGALCAHWPQRLQYAGTYDEAWQRRRAPLWPTDFDPRFFQIAPLDQQFDGFLRGDEVCTLYNLTPDGWLRFSLPNIRMHVTTRFADARLEERIADLHTLVIDGDERRLVMVWHMALPCHGREHLIQHSTIKYQGRQSWLELPQSTSTT